MVMGSGMTPSSGGMNWLVGILNWHRECDRYTEPGLLRRYGTGPRRLIGSMTGLGTDAARVCRPSALATAISRKCTLPD
jgi:hypothetical protein